MSDKLEITASKYKEMCEVYEDAKFADFTKRTQYTEGFRDGIRTILEMVEGSDE
jgi:hypothetical protein